jgi:GWxTD domain-containing protein
VPAFLALLLGLSSGSYGEEPLRVYCGVSQSPYPELDSLVLVDFPFTVNQHEFEFFRKDSSDTFVQARIFAQVTIFGVNGLAVDSANTVFAVRAESAGAAAAEGIRLFNRLSLLLAPGVYTARLTVIDVASKREGSFFIDNVVVEPLVKDRLTIGGTCLAYNITYVGDQASPDDRLVRNGLRILHNPLRVLGLDDTTMFLYAEVYNLSEGGADADQYRVSYSLTDKFGAVVQNYGSRTVRKPGPTAVIAESFNIRDLAPELYILRMEASDLATGQADTQLVGFRIVSPQQVLAMDNSESTDPCDSLGLEVQMRLAHYLLGPVERETLKQLTDIGKLAYLRQYWIEHDSDPGTKLIENRLEMYQRYLTCNRLFSSTQEESNGWLSDRGRIYMMYGPYDEREDNQTPRMGHPFEVWSYYGVRDGAVFVFVDEPGQHDYRLVHSNVQGERYSDYWATQIKQADFFTK